MPDGSEICYLPRIEQGPGRILDLVKLGGQGPAEEIEEFARKRNIATGNCRKIFIRMSGGEAGTVTEERLRGELLQLDCSRARGKSIYQYRQQGAHERGKSLKKPRQEEEKS